MVDDHLAARDVEEDTARDTADRVGCGDLVTIERVPLDLGRLEEDPGWQLGVEELGRPQVRVALGLARVTDAASISIRTVAFVG